MNVWNNRNYEGILKGSLPNPEEIVKIILMFGHVVRFWKLNQVENISVPIHIILVICGYHIKWKLSLIKK